MTLHPFLKFLADAGVYDPPEYATRPANGYPPGGGTGPPLAPDDPRLSRWVTAAVVAECDDIARTPAGGRNHALNHGAFRLGQLVGAGWLDQHAVRDALIDAGLACGLELPEILATIRSGLLAGIGQPRHVDLGPAASQVEAAYTVAAEGPQDEAGERGEQAAPGDGLDLAEHLPQPLDWHEAWATAHIEPDWLVVGMIERGRSHVIYAPQKIGKSLLAQTLSGVMVTHGVRVLYVDLENSLADIVERFTDMGYGPDDLHDLIYLSFPSMAALDTATGGATLAALVEHHRIELVVIDTVSRVISGEENSADTFRSLYRHALVPLKAGGVTVVRLDHAGKNPMAGQRGSSAKGDDVDTVWQLIGHSDEIHYQLKCDAQRSGHHPQVIDLVKQEDPLRFERVDHNARPEITALIEQMDRLGLPGDAGNRVARQVLRAAGVSARNSVLAEAVRARQTRVDQTILNSPESNDTRYDEKSILVAGKRQSDTKINKGVPQDQLQFDVSPAQTFPGNVGERGERPAESLSADVSPTPCPPRGDTGNACAGPVPDRAQSEPKPNTSPPTGLTHPWQPSGEPAKPWLCQRCRRPAERLTGPIHGRQWCPVCAYPDPADRPGHDDEEDN